MTHASEAFEQHATEYDAARRRLIPPFDRFYGAAVEAVGPRQPRSVLDLGAGTGLLSMFVREANPGVELILLDGSRAMLEQARSTLGDEGVQYLIGYLSEPLPLRSAATEGRGWDAVVSALAIHHLDDTGKRRLYQRIYAALEPGGVFVNAEQVSGPSPFWSSSYERWHAASAAAAGATEQEWNDALERMSHDRCAPVGEQLTWLRDCGFAEVDCVFKDHRFAVLVAIR